MEFVPMLAMAALIYKLVDLLRYLTNGDKNGVITQLCTWGFAIGAVMLYAHSGYAKAITFSGMTLAGMGVWSQVVVGLQLGSLASAGKDLLKAVDESNSAKIPTLLPAGPTAPSTADVG